MRPDKLIFVGIRAALPDTLCLFWGFTQLSSIAIMPNLSTADKFLGSLLGAYIGHSCSTLHQGQWPPVRESHLYQAWQASIQPSTVLGPHPLKTSLVAALPWLLHHHDDATGRHHWLAQAIAPLPLTETSPTVTAIEMFYILGDCLEWLLQFPSDTQKPYLLLCEHLRQRCITYPPPFIPRLNLLIEGLNMKECATDVQAPYQAQTVCSMTLALRRCLRYPENLALALSNHQTDIRMSSIIGCLLGAWGGTPAIPVPWIMAFTQDSRHDLRQMAQQLYRSWAGSNVVIGRTTIFPLDL